MQFKKQLRRLCQNEDLKNIIYAVLVQGIATGGDPIGAIWGCIGYTVLLCFILMKTGTIAKSVFNAH